MKLLSLQQLHMLLVIAEDSLAFSDVGKIFKYTIECRKDLVEHIHANMAESIVEVQNAPE